MRASRTRSAAALRTAAVALGACAVVTGGAGAAGAAPGDSFTISGNVNGALYPGGSGPVDLVLTNITGNELTVGEITVSVAAVSTQPQQQCLIADFAVTQLDQTLQFTLSANATRSLSQLGVAAAGLPRVAMTNTPVNQDGCKGSTVNLAFNGRAAEVGGVALPPSPSPSPDPSPSPSPSPADPETPDLGGVELPGTGADSSTFAMALAGFGLVTIGGTSVLVARRMRGAQK